MKVHLITIGEPKLVYARAGWNEYLARLKHYHTVRVTHIADKRGDAEHILLAAGQAYMVALVIDTPGCIQFSSPELAKFIEQHSQDGREAAFLIGGPDGLPVDVIHKADMSWSLSQLTFPHDLAMVILVETLYRASTIAAGQPYHR